MQIIVKDYSHFNRAMGKYIKSKDHYDYEMKAGGYVDYDKANEMADKYNKESKKAYVLSDKAKAIINAAKNGADRKGRVKLGDRTIKAMKEIGALKDIPESAPKAFHAKGGYL